MQELKTESTYMVGTLHRLYIADYKHNSIKIMSYFVNNLRSLNDFAFIPSRVFRASGINIYRNGKPIS